MNFAVSADHRIKLKEREKKDKYLDLARKWKNVKYECDDYTPHYWNSWYSHRRIRQDNGGLGNKRTSRAHPYYNIIEIGQNTKKSPGDLRRLAITQTPVKDHQLTLM